MSNRFSDFDDARATNSNGSAVSVSSGESTVGIGSNAALRSALRKAYWRLLPILFICYIIAYIDRTNVAIATLTMEKDMPAFDAWVFGVGSGIFFLGYFLLEIPGSLIVEHWSARKWICRIMVTWGFMAALTAFVKTPMQFYTVRFLLGMAEAGFFPGVIVYLSHWFPQKERARAIAYFLIATPIANIIGPAVSQWFIDIGQTVVDPKTGQSIFIPELWGMKGWQWVYIIWGIPAVLFGLFVLFGLTDRPRQAGWLTEEEKDALEEELLRDKETHRAAGHMTLVQALSSPRVLLLSFAYFGIVTANYGIEMFLPRVIKEWYPQLQNSRVASLVMIPSLLVIPGQLFVGWSSDKRQERRWHSVVPVVIGAVFLVLVTMTQGWLIGTLICFSIAAAGMKSYMPAFWALPSLFLTSTAAAGSIGLINSIGNLGGALGPYVMGYMQANLKSYTLGLLFLALTSTLSAMLITFLPLRKPGDEIPEE
jgi:sugar phosphate permease